MGLTQSTQNGDKSRYNRKYSDQEIAQRVNKLFANNRFNEISEASQSFPELNLYEENMSSDTVEQLGGTPKRYKQYESKIVSLMNDNDNGNALSELRLDLSEFDLIRSTIDNNQSGGDCSIGLPDALSDTPKNNQTHFNIAELLGVQNGGGDVDMEDDAAASAATDTEDEADKEEYSEEKMISESSYNTDTDINVLPFYSNTSDFAFQAPYVKNRF